MSRYLIKLTPLDTFFFGQENKYRKKLKDNKFVTEADYFQRSAYFPQQTTILGALRYYLLQRAGQIPITDSKLATELIGSKSFDAGETKPNFGKISNLSPVYIIDEALNFYCQNPRDLLLIDEKPNYLKKETTTFKSNISSENILFFKNYVEKEGLSNFLVNDDQRLVLPFEYKQKEQEDGVFIEKERIGITKGKDGKTADEAFYKQIAYSLREGFAFGFTAEIIDETLIDEIGFVSMGAEKSPFKITFTKQNSSFDENICLNTENAPKVVLLSDSFISDEHYDTKQFLFSLSETIPFRFLETTVVEGHKYYSSDPNKGKEMTRSKKFNLFKRGSVFYFKNEDQLTNFCGILKDKEPNFYQIGYNHFKIIK